MACPYFFPTEKSTNIYWPFPRRLPLGAGYCGTCTAGSEQITPAEHELREFCNIGYARQCARMPTERPSDAVRFSIAKDGGNRILLHYCCERDHAPVRHGQLEYDCASQGWLTGHLDSCLLRQAECYVAGYLERKSK